MTIQANYLNKYKTTHSIEINMVSWFEIKLKLNLLLKQIVIKWQCVGVPEFMCVPNVSAMQ